MPTISQIGYCKYIIPEEGSSNFSETAYAQDVIKGRGVNFSFNYSWSGNNCTISEVRWKPGKIEYDSITHERSFVQEGLESNGFQSANNIDENRIVLKIQFGQGESGIVPTNQDGHKSIYANKTYTPDNSDWSVTINTTNNFLLANFKYQYTGTSTGVTYIVEIKDIKIPRTNKYENNVIFNKDGLNELIDHFQKYPVIGVKQSNKYGHIKITHGKDPNNPVDVGIQGFRYSTTDNLFCGTDFLPYMGNDCNLGELYIPLYTPDDYRIDKIYYKKEGNSYTSLGKLSQEEVTNIMTGTTEQPAITPLYTTHKWKNLYLSGDIGSSMENGKIGNIYATKGDFSGTITADTLTGNLVGGSIKIGGTTSNPKFQVNSDGDVIMNGSITWGNGNPLKQIYHRGVTNGTNQHAQPALPSQSQSYDSMTSDGASWHKICHSTDYWMTFSTDGGKTWQTPTRINAQDGKDGEPGEWKPETIIDALHLINGDGIFEFDDPVAGSNEIQKLLGIKATAVLAALIEANKINVNGGTSYSPTDATKFKGGYLTFRVPTPWTSRHALNASGFSARLGYLRGNGNGEQATAGIGIAIQTQATYNQAFPNSKKTGGDKLHLLISSLMLTDSGLGLTLAANTAEYTTQSNSNWFTTDYGFGGKYHYTYKYINGSTSRLTWINGDASSGYNAGERGYRLWLHEDNGGLYYLDPDNGFKPWQWEI